VSPRSLSRRAALTTGVALGAVCALGAWPADGGAEAAAIELLPAADGAEVADRWRLERHRVLRVHGARVVAGEAGGLTVAVVRDGDAELAVGVEGGVGAPVVWEVGPAGARTARPDLTTALRANLERARAERRRPRLGPGRAEASHAVAQCATLLATAAGMLVLCSRGQFWACQAGYAASLAAVTWCV
jgi:hypothetical protein